MSELRLGVFILLCAVTAVTPDCKFNSTFTLFISVFAAVTRACVCVCVCGPAHCCEMNMITCECGSVVPAVPPPPAEFRQCALMNPGKTLHTHTE